MYLSKGRLFYNIHIVHYTFTLLNPFNYGHLNANAHFKQCSTTCLNAHLNHEKLLVNDNLAD